MTVCGSWVGIIEYDLPLADISEEPAREKSICHGHPSSLHVRFLFLRLQSRYNPSLNFHEHHVS
jgi:hypothetical protein